MEKARYSLWTKRKHDLNTHVLSSSSYSSHGESWEEQAFAEDAGGDLGGCIWPPRSYTCSFCRREFRSAQALGGHMNVHRRDRARMKQSPCSQTEAFPHKNILNPCPPLRILYNPNFDTDHKVLASPFLSARVLAPTIKVNTDENRVLAPNLFPIVQERRKAILPSFPPRSTMAAEEYFRVSDPSSSSDDAEEGGASCKKRRTEAAALTFFPKQDPIDMKNLRSPRSIDDLDLELRLGDPPKAKASLLVKIDDCISPLPLEIAGFDYNKVICGRVIGADGVENFQKIDHKREGYP